jgi:hypothetical protein
MDGLLTEVLVSTNGSAATAPVAIGETSVPVENLTEFASDGGRVDIAGVVYDYTGVDATSVDPEGVGGSILLPSPGLTVAVGEFDPVLLVVGDEPAVDFYAVVDLIDDEDGEPVWVPLETREERLAWPVRVYDPPLPVTLSADLSQILRAPGVTPQMDGSLIDPATLPPTPGGQTISDDAPTDTTGYPEDYGWWQVVDGDVVGFWRLVAGVWTPQTIVTVEALQAGNILTEALTGTTITGATVQTRADQDRGIKLIAALDDEGDVVDALYIYAENGVPFIKAVPSEGLAVIAGEIKAVTLTVTDGASLGGITEITRHSDGTPGALRLTAFTTAPKSAPVVTTGYDTVQFTADGKWGNRSGWATDGTYWYTGRYTSSGEYVEKWNAAGALVATSAKLNEFIQNVAVYGGNVYVFTYVGSTGAWRVHQYDAATLTKGAHAVWNHADDFADRPSIGVDPGTGELILAQDRSTNDWKVRIRRYTWPTTSGDPLVLVGTFVDTDSEFGSDLASITYGTHDFGADHRYVLTNRTGGRFRTFGTTGSEVADEGWTAGGMDFKVGFAYTGGVFVSMDQNGLMRTYTGQDKTTPTGHANLTKWVSNTLANATLETDQSPRAKIVFPKRSKLNVTTSSINSGGTNAPDRVKVYVGQGSTSPARTAMWKQTDPAVGVITTTYASLATSGTNPPAANGFVAAGGTVQGVELADGTTFVDGLGKGSAWTAYPPTWTATTTNPTIGNGSIVGRYARLGRNTVKGVIVLTVGSTTNMGSGSYRFRLPVAARDPDFVVMVAISSSPTTHFMGRGNITDALDILLYPIGSTTQLGSTNAGFSAGTVLRIPFEYEAVA